MTQQVRKGYRSHRKATWAAVLVVLVAAALVATVMPATGAPGDQTGLPSDPVGAPPIENAAGGNTFNCSDVNPTPGLSQFKINNPKTGTYTATSVEGYTVKFTITVSGGASRDKYLSFRTDQGAVSNVAINGGTKTAVYSYASPVLADGYGSGTLNPLSVDTDASNNQIGLHAPVDSAGNPYSLSYTTFCYEPATVSPSCTDPFSGFALGGPVGYEAQLEPSATGGCKQDDVFMYTYRDGTKFFATLHPTSPPAPPYYRVVEHITWEGFSDGQNPVTMWFDDTAPYDGGDKITMRMCKIDPRLDPTADPFELDSTKTDAQILPTVNGVQHTSCMIESTDAAGGKYEAWVFSNVDGARGSVS